MTKLAEKLHNPLAERSSKPFTTVLNTESKFVLKKDKMKNALEEKRKLLKEMLKFKNAKLDKPDEIETLINKKNKGK